MGIAVWALIVHLTTILIRATVVRRDSGEAMIIGLLVLCLFGGANFFALLGAGLGQAFAARGFRRPVVHVHRVRPDTDRHHPRSSAHSELHAGSVALLEFAGLLISNSDSIPGPPRLSARPPTGFRLRLGPLRFFLRSRAAGNQQIRSTVAGTGLGTGHIWWSTHHRLPDQATGRCCSRPRCTGASRRRREGR
jgi:hypothetical protein